MARDVAQRVNDASAEFQRLLSKGFTPVGKMAGCGCCESCTGDADCKCCDSCATKNVNDVEDKSWITDAGATRDGLDDGDFAWLSDAYKAGKESKSEGRKFPYKIHGKVNERGWKAAWNRAHSSPDSAFTGGPSRAAIEAKLKASKPDGVQIGDDGKSLTEESMSDKTPEEIKAEEEAAAEKARAEAEAKNKATNSPEGNAGGHSAEGTQSNADQTKAAQAVHDNAVALGATCSENHAKSAETITVKTGEVEFQGSLETYLKLYGGEGQRVSVKELEQAKADLAAKTAEFDTLTTDNATVVKERDELKAKLEAAKSKGYNPLDKDSETDAGDTKDLDTPASRKFWEA